MTKFSHELFAVLVLGNTSIALAQTSLYATGTGGLYTINAATGATTALGAPTDANLASGGLAYDSANSTLYATGLDNSSHSAFYSLNTGTGAATKIAQISNGYSFDTGGLAYDSTHNVLYATATSGGSSTSFFSINPSTGAATLIGGTTTTTTNSSAVTVGGGNQASPVQISSLLIQLQSLQTQIQNASGPQITAIQNQINTVTNDLNAQVSDLNNDIANLNTLVQSAVNNGVPGVPAVPITITPLPPVPGVTTTTTTTTTHNFTLLGLGYKSSTDTLFANGMIGGTSSAIVTQVDSGTPTNSSSSTGADTSGQGSVVFTLNRGSGAPTNLGYAGVSAGSSFSSGGLDYDPVTGALYAIGSVTGSTDGLYTINTTTGHATLVAAFSPGLGALGGLAFAPTAIPEPSTYATLFGLTALGFAVYRSRRR